MSLAGTDPRYRYFVAIYRCDVVASGPFTLVSGDAKLELFREERTYFPGERGHGVFAAVKGAEYCFPARAPILLDARCQHLVVTARSKLGKAAAQPRCEKEIDRVVSLMGALLTPDLFRTLLFRGWLRGGPPDRDLGLLVKGVPPVEIDTKILSGDLSKATGAIDRSSAAGDRFALMSRFIAKGMAEPPSEEAFVWLWTALEIFPMVDTTDIRPISVFLADYVQLEPSVAKERLRIGWLFGMRSKLVHDGYLPLDRQDRFSALANLEAVVRAVVRHAAGLGYDRALDHILRRGGEQAAKP